MIITNKQHVILSLIEAKNADGTEIDFDELMERIPWKTTKESMQFTLRSMIAKRLIEKGELERRRRARRRVFRVLPGGLFVLKEVAPPHDPENYFAALRELQRVRESFGKSECEPTSNVY